MANREQQTPLGPGVVDRGAYNYGGDPSAANNEAMRLQNQAKAAQGRQGEQIDTANADAAMGQAGQSRDAQLSMADLMRRRALGQTPSIAGMRADQDMNRAAAEQSSAAASARGPAGLAIAQQGAAANTAAAQSNISNNAQINSAQERLNAEQGAFGAFSNMRQGDQAQQGQNFSQGLAQSQLNAQQRAQNDQFTLGNQAQSIGVQGMQLGADMNRDAAEQAGHFNAAGLQEQKNQASDANLMGYIGMGASTAAAAAPMLSDERTKVPARFGGGGAAPIDTGYGQSNEDVRSGYDTNSVSMAKMVAHRALDEQATQHARDASASTGVAGGPAAFDMNPGKRWDSEDLGLIQAKQRNGADLSAKEEASKASLMHRAGSDKADAAKAPSAAAAAAKAPAYGAADAAAAGLGSIGKALGSMSANTRPQQAWHYQGPATYGTPQLTQSDERTKTRTESPADKKAREDAEDAETTRKFMGEAKGLSYEERSKAIDERNAQDKQLAAEEKRRAQAPAIAHANQADARSAQRVEPYRAVPVVGSWMRRMVESRASQSDDEKAARGAEGQKDDAEWLATKKKVNDWASAKLPESVREAAVQAPAAIGYRPEHDSRQVRQPTSFQRETTSDEKAKAKIDYANPKEIKSIGNDPDGTQRHWDSDVSASSRPDGASLSGPAPRYSHASESRPAEPAAPKTRKYTDAELQRMGNEMLGTQRAQHESQLGAGPSSHDSHDGPKWLHDYMASDERTKRQVGHLGPEVDHHDMADAALSMRAVPYAYKPEFAGREGQRPGEVNIGPVAQEMQKSPVAATAVKQDSPDGIRAIDIPKFTKVLGGIAADQQEQLNEQKRQISIMARRLGGRR